MKIFYAMLICLLFAFIMPNETIAEGEKKVEKIIANSIRWGDFTNTYTYDKCGKYSIAVREKMEDNELLDWDFLAYTYDEDGNLIAEIYNWHDGEVWVDCDSITYSYDESGNMLQKYYIYWDETEWLNMQCTTNTYDDSGNMLTTFIEEGNYGGEGWLPYFRTSNTFDSEGNKIVELKERVVAGELTNYFWNKFTYNEKNLVTGLTQEYWTGQWDFVTRGVYTYDENDNLTGIVYESFENDVWSNYSRYVRSYNENGDILVRSYEKWVDEAWVGNTRYTYTWNEFNKLLTYNIEKYSSGEYQPSTRQIFTLAEGGYRTNIAHSAWVAGQWIDSDAYIGMTDSAGNRFLFNTFYNLDITWSGGTSVESDTQDNIKMMPCFPNPTHDIVNVDYTLMSPGILTVSITNTQGNEISRLSDNQMKEPGNHNLSYNTTDLPPGVYYLTVQSNDFSETKKFVVVR
jgi:hypothetical protein